MSDPLPWIKLYARLPRHKKSLKLDELLRRRRAWTHVVELWMWASENAPSGDLSDLSSRQLARAAGWHGNAEKFANALREAGFLDDDGQLYAWTEYQMAHAARVDDAWNRVALCAEYGWDDREWDRRYRWAKRNDSTPAHAPAKSVRDVSTADPSTDTGCPPTVREVSVAASARDQDREKDSKERESAREPARQRSHSQVPSPDVECVKAAWVKWFKPDPAPTIDDTNWIRMQLTQIGITAERWSELIEAYAKDPFWNGGKDGENKLDLRTRFRDAEGFRRGARLLAEQQVPPPRVRPRAYTLPPTAAHVGADKGHALLAALEAGGGP